MKLKTYISLIVLTMSVAMPARAQQGVGDGVEIIAHRGYWNNPEAGYARNSLAAFKCAQKAGFFGSEFDVSLTADDRIVVYHDRKVGGKDFNSHPYSDFADERLENGEPIPLVEDFFRQAAAVPGTKMVYELKPQSTEAFEDRLVELSIRKLEEFGLDHPDKVMFISFSMHICKKLSEEMPGFTVQYLGTKKPSEVYAEGVHGIDCNKTLLKLARWRIAKAKELGMSVNCWTVNKERTIRKMARLGVDQMTTDNPDLAAEILEKR